MSGPSRPRGGLFFHDGAPLRRPPRFARLRCLLLGALLLPLAAALAWSLLASVGAFPYGPGLAIAALGIALGHTPRQPVFRWAPPDASSASASATASASAFASAAASCPSPWRDAYASLHASILSGRLPPRYLYSVASNTGASDRMAGTVSLLYWAVLSGRAFQLATFDDLPDFGKAFDSPFLDWGGGPRPAPGAIAALRRIPPLVPDWVFAGG